MQLEGRSKQRRFCVSVVTRLCFLAIGFGEHLRGARAGSLPPSPIYVLAGFDQEGFGAGDLYLSMRPSWTSGCLHGCQIILPGIVCKLSRPDRLGLRSRDAGIHAPNSFGMSGHGWTVAGFVAGPRRRKQRTVFLVSPQESRQKTGVVPQQVPVGGDLESRRWDEVVANAGK